MISYDLMNEKVTMRTDYLYIFEKGLYARTQYFKNLFEKTIKWAKKNMLKVPNTTLYVS